MKKPINKLVRDNIPYICMQNGQVPETRILDGESYTAALKEKLQEEVREYLADDTIEELADILEVIEALAEDRGASLNAVMEAKARKQAKNGAFRDKIYLISTEG